MVGTAAGRVTCPPVPLETDLLVNRAVMNELSSIGALASLI